MLNIKFGIMAVLSMFWVIGILNGNKTFKSLRENILGFFSGFTDLLLGFGPVAIVSWITLGGVWLIFGKKYFLGVLAILIFSKWPQLFMGVILAFYIRRHIPHEWLIPFGVLMAILLIVFRPSSPSPPSSSSEEEEDW